MNKKVKDLKNNEIGVDKEGNYWLGRKVAYLKEEEKEIKVNVLDFTDDNEDFFTFADFMGNGGGVQLNINSNYLTLLVNHPKRFLLSYGGCVENGKGRWYFVTPMGIDIDYGEGYRFDTYGSVVI